MDHLKIAQLITDLLENKFEAFGKKYGLDPLLGLVPVYGDLISLVFSLYILWVGKRMLVPNNKYQVMVKNVFFDAFLGFIPLIGDLADFTFKANSKNMEIIRKYGQHMTEGEIIEMNYSAA